MGSRGVPPNLYFQARYSMFRDAEQQGLRESDEHWIFRHSSSGTLDPMPRSCAKCCNKSGTTHWSL